MKKNNQEKNYDYIYDWEKKNYDYRYDRKNFFLTTDMTEEKKSNKNSKIKIVTIYK